MNFTMNESALRKQVMVALMMVVPVFAWAQHRNAPAPHPSAPAPHASAPAHNSAPSRPSGPTQHTTPHTTQHTTAPARTNTNTRTTPGSTGHTSTMNTGRTGTSTTGKTGTTTNGRTNTTVNGRTNTGAAGKTAGTNTAGKTSGTVGKPGATTGGKGVTAGGHGTTTASKANMSRTPPGRTVSLKGGGKASIRPNGQIRSVSRNGMQIQHGLHGGRTVVSTRNGARVVTTGRHGGYVQRNYVSRNGNTYVSRTYVVNNVSYTNVYRSYGYGDYCCYYGYAPAYYYQPAYYGWAYNPWPAPVYYGWGWGGAPWYGYYGGYFAPYPVYPSAAFWLTDYLIATSLQAAFAAQAEEGASLGPLASDQLVASLGAIPGAAAASNAVALSPEVKKVLADEVKAQLAEEQGEAGKSGGASTGGAAAAGAAPPALDPNRRTFVVSDELSVVADGEECSLTAGDVINRLTDTPDGDKNVNVMVLASKKSDCAVGKQVAVSVEDLQEMHNHFREKLTSGMGELAKKQGTGGLPKAPDTSTKDGEVPAPPVDKAAAKTLEEQQKAADQTEAEVKQEAGSSGGGSQ